MLNQVSKMMHKNFLTDMETVRRGPQLQAVKYEQTLLEQPVSFCTT